MLTYILHMLDRYSKIQQNARYVSQDSAFCRFCLETAAFVGLFLHWTIEMNSINY